MSHLQPAFIAKSKARVRQAHAPQRMSNSMIRRQASIIPVENIFTGKVRHECCFWPDHRIFVLRK